MKLTDDEYRELPQSIKTRYEAVNLHPELHCDYKCLRTGYCRFHCDQYEFVEKK